MHKGAVMMQNSMERPGKKTEELWDPGTPLLGSDLENITS